MENWENLLNLPFVITYCRKSRRRFPQFTYPTHTELYTKSVRKNIHRSQCCGVHQLHSQNVLNINGLSIWSFMKIIFCGKSFSKICMQNNIRYRPILAEKSHTIPSKLVSMRLYQWMFNLMVPLRYSKIYTENQGRSSPPSLYTTCRRLGKSHLALYVCVIINPTA